MDRINLLNNFYSSINEDGRLCNSRHGELEYMTTMHYIHQYLKAGDSVLEVGAGTGRYSIALAHEGFNVKAVELVQSNIEVMKRNIGYSKNIEALQGDALDLSRFEDSTFDLTLVLGPMYHLFDEKDQNRAIDEAIRVTKTNGVIFFAFLSIDALLYCNFLKGNFEAGLKIYLDESYSTRHCVEQRFTGFEISDFEKLFADKNVEHITTAGVDSIIELAEQRNDFKMPDKDFKLFFKYHLKNCEKRELLGASSHLLYICRKISF